MGGTAYAVTVAPPNSVNTAALQNLAVTTPKLADEAVDNAKIAADAVTGGKIAPDSITSGHLVNNSVSLTDMVGVNVTETVSLSVAAHACREIVFPVSGAKAGQAALMTWTGAMPTHVVFTPMRVVSSTEIISFACNLTGSTYSAGGFGVRVVTFG